MGSKLSHHKSSSCTAKLVVASDIIYEYNDAYSFLIPNTECTNIYSSKDGKIVLTISYIKKNNLFGKPLQLMRSHDMLIVNVVFNEISCSLIRNQRVVCVGEMIVNEDTSKYFIDYF